MIQKFVDRFMTKKAEITAVFTAKHPDRYADIVLVVVTALHDQDTYSSIDPDRIHQIDDEYNGACGTSVFVIAESCRSPSDYWYIRVSYGSCCYCDILKAIRDSNYDEKPTKQQVTDYMTLALHIVQGLKRMGGKAGLPRNNNFQSIDKDRYARP